MNTKEFKPWKEPAVVGSIAVFGALTYCVFLHFMYDLKVAHLLCER